MTTPERTIEEIVREFREEFLSDRGLGEVPQYVPAQFDFSDYTDWLTQTLQAERQKRDEMVEAHHQELQKAREEERERIRQEVKDMARAIKNDAHFMTELQVCEWLTEEVLSGLDQPLPDKQ